MVEVIVALAVYATICVKATHRIDSSENWSKRPDGSVVRLFSLRALISTAKNNEMMVHAEQECLRKGVGVAIDNEDARRLTSQGPRLPVWEHAASSRSHTRVFSFGSKPCGTRVQYR